MENEEVFTQIEKSESENKLKETSEEINYETPFVTSLPSWDLAPPYEVIKRGNNL